MLRRNIMGKNNGSSRGGCMDKADRDNRANQLNPNNDAYWSCRGMSKDDVEEDD